MTQMVELLHVAQVAGQEMQLGDERKVPGRQEEHEVMAPAEMEQLTHPTERD